MVGIPTGDMQCGGRRDAAYLHFIDKLRPTLLGHSRFDLGKVPIGEVGES
jgi:hypothetical protein